MSNPFLGLSAFPLTCADDAGRVDTEALGRSLEPLVAAGVDSIGLLGSTGIYAYLDRSERNRAVAAAVEAVGGRVSLIVGVGALRTDWTCELAREAERLGANALLLAPVSYTPLTEDEVFGHYEAVTGASGLPLCVYNNPGTTHFSFSEALIGRLSRLPSVAAIKMPPRADGDYAGEIRRLREESRAAFAIGYSGDWVAAPALLAGADAWYSIVAGLLPVQAQRLVRAARSAEPDEASASDRTFAPLWGLFRAHGSLRVMYALARLLDLSAGNPPMPIRPLSVPAQDELAQVLEALIRHG